MPNIGNIDSKLLVAIQSSSCFGIAFDEDTPECQMCDVKSSCKAKVLGTLGIPTPVIREELKADSSGKKKKTTKKAKSKSKLNGKLDQPKNKSKGLGSINTNMPNFKSMSLDDIKKVARERGVEWTEYNSESITRMRLIMSLKKTY